MEHRLSQRIRLTHTARITSSSGRAGIAQLQELSASGARLRTLLRLPDLAFVRVQFKLRRGAQVMMHSVDAIVVRRVNGGIAIEWSEFMPDAVRELLHMPHDQSRPPVRHRDDHVAGVHRLPRICGKRLRQRRTH
jgi:hypothetical protein